MRAHARLMNLTRSAWRVLVDHAPRLIAAVQPLEPFVGDPFRNVYLYARLLARSGLTQPLPPGVLRVLAQLRREAALAQPRFDDPLIEDAHPMLLRALVVELHSRGHVDTEGRPLEPRKLDEFLDNEWWLVASWQSERPEDSSGERRPLPWSWWHRRAAEWMLAGMPLRDGPLHSGLDRECEWPVLVPPFERDGIAVEEIWSVAGLIREALRMHHCIGEREFAIAALEGRFRAYRLARADNDQRFATVSLVRQGECFAVDQVRGFANADVPEIAWQIARELAWWASAAIGD
jgi:hypothetical protein